ncbi:MAG: exodeoxyribonuclease VII large subunit, partial [Saprospiraceae bacterium]
GRTDLAAFDNLPLAIRIAEFPIPVLIGIGHEIDQSVLDLVAYKSLKTPTAVADFVIEHNASFESHLDEVWQWIQDEAMDRLRSENQKLTDLAGNLHHAAKSRILLENNKLDHILLMLRQGGKNMISSHSKRIEFIHSLLTAIDPDRVLARGYTITTHDGKSVNHSSQLNRGMTIQTTFQDGTVKSIVE